MATYDNVEFNSGGSYNIYESPALSAEVNSVDNWISTYKNTSLNQAHDQSELNLILPDDCLVVIGAPRLRDMRESELYVVGYLNGIQYSETRQVQPLKSIGSRRHIFAATNGPVQGSINRMLFVGDNLLRALHKLQNVPSSISAHPNSTYYAGEMFNDSTGKGEWFVNVEEDLFRIPFGLGIIYNAPSTMSGGSKGKGVAEYLEGCTLVNRAVSLQSGQAMVMEQVSFMADRVVGWTAWNGATMGA